MALFPALPEARFFLAGTRQPGVDSFLSCPRTSCRPERAKARLRMQNPGSSELCDGDSSCVFERAWLQPRYRGLAHTVRPREIGLASPSIRPRS